MVGCLKSWHMLEENDVNNPFFALSSARTVLRRKIMEQDGGKGMFSQEPTCGVG